MRDNDYLGQARLLAVKAANFTEASRDKLIYGQWGLETVKKPNH